MIIINSNEATNKKLIQAFKRQKIPFRIMPTKVGDFTNDKGTFIVERKSISDFWSSINDQRIDAQPKEMYETYSGNRYVFIEAGAFQHTAIIKKQRNRVYSKYGQIENWECNIREYIDFDDLVLKLDSLDKYLGEERKVRERRKVIKGVPDNIKFLMGLGGVGEKRSTEMIEEMGNAWNVLVDIIENDGDKLSRIYGIKKGGAILTKIKDTLLMQK